MAAFIEEMPKAELHMHIEGVLEPGLKFEMAARNGIELPYDSVDDVNASYDFNDLSTFLDARYEGDTVLITETDFYDLAMAYYNTVARENLVYAEIFFDPQAHTTRGVEFIKRMLDEGMLPTVNSDDPAYFRGYMNDNLAVAQRDGDLSAAEVGQLMRNAFAMSWTTDTRKQDYLAALDEFLAASAGVEPE